jgi:hypothetical protein
MLGYASVSRSALKLILPVCLLVDGYSSVIKSSCLHLVQAWLCLLVRSTAQRSCPSVAENAHIQLWPKGISAATLEGAVLDAASFLSRSPPEQAPFYL